MECAHCRAYVEFEIQKDGEYCPKCGWIQPTPETIKRDKIGSRTLKWVAWATIIVGIIGAGTIIMLYMIFIGIGLLKRWPKAYSRAFRFERYQLYLGIFVSGIGVLLSILSSIVELPIEGGIALITLGIINSVFSRIILKQLNKPEVRILFNE